MFTRVPSSSIPRISLYYRAILSLKENDFISSRKLAEITRCGSSQVRRDLAYFGQFGRPGCGYPVEILKKELKKILGIDKEWKVALVGAGNLGSALLAYRSFKSQGFNIQYAFDNDPKKINRIKQGIKISDIKDVERTVRSEKINIAIVAVPQEAAIRIIERLIASGIKAILNFAPVRPRVPGSVELLNIDLSIELERLTYFLGRSRA